MYCFNKVNLSAILLVHKRIINKDCTVKNNNEMLIVVWMVKDFAAFYEIRRFISVFTQAHLCTMF